MKKYLIFGSRATNALWEDENDLEGVIEAINDLEAELFIFDPENTPIDKILSAYSKWSDYSYLTKDQYEEIITEV